MLQFVLLLLLSLVSLSFAVDPCFQVREKGDSSCGESGVASFYFDKLTKRCQPFYYKGCGGNDNRFSTREQCQEKCSGATESSASPAANAVCASGAFSAGATSGSPVSCSECPTGYECEGEVCCPTKDFLCSLQYDAGKFGASGKHTPRYYFSRAYANCMLFTFYGRDGNANNFATYNQCKEFCS